MKNGLKSYSFQPSLVYEAVDGVGLNYQFVGEANFAEGQDLVIDKNRPIKNINSEADIPLHPMPASARKGETYLDRSALYYPGSVGIMREIDQIFEDYLINIGLHTKDSINKHIYLPQNYVHGNFHCMEAALLSKIKEDESFKQEVINKLSKHNVKKITQIFPSKISKELANELNLELNNSPDIAYKANHKGEFRKNAKYFGYRVPLGKEIGADGGEIKDVDNIFNYAVNCMINKQNVWMKFPTGSGGELVVPIKANDFKGMESSQIRNKICEIAEKKLALAVKSSINPEKILTKNDITTDEMYTLFSKRGLVMEVDLMSMPNSKEIIGNYNAQCIIKGGEILPTDFSVQSTTDDGIYMGNLLQDLHLYPEDIYNKVLESTVLVGKYLKNLKYRGIFGIDVILVNEGDTIVPYVIDINSRPNGSTGSSMMRQEFNAFCCQNVNIKFNNPVDDIEEALILLKNVLISKNVNQVRNEVSGVLLKMLKDGQDNLGQVGKINGAKVDLLANNKNGINDIINQLNSLGVKILQ